MSDIINTDKNENMNTNKIINKENEKVKNEKNKNNSANLLFPNKYVEKITDIDSRFLKERNISAIIIDVDNTVMDFKRDIIDGLVEWYNELKNNNIRVIILSNTSKKTKATKVAELLNIDYFMRAKKPRKKGFLKATNKLNTPLENIAVIGDQVYTDVLGANKLSMFSILVNPLNENKEHWFTKLKRPFEERVLLKYLEYIRNNELEEYKEVVKVFEQRLKNKKDLKDKDKQ